MSLLDRRIVRPLRLVLGGSKREDGGKPSAYPENVVPESGFPKSLSVNSISLGPGGVSAVIAGVSHMGTSEGGVVLGCADGFWRYIPMPDDVAAVRRIVRLTDGAFAAAGMSSLGRAVLLRGDVEALEWVVVPLDTARLLAVTDLCVPAEGTLLASSQRTTAPGRVRPVLLRSENGGRSFSAEDVDFPVSNIVSLSVGPSGGILAGTAGDTEVLLLRSLDSGRSWEAVLGLPASGTYKMTHAGWLDEAGRERPFVILWGCRSGSAERFVGMYLLGEDGWREMPAPEGARFIFSFHVSSSGAMYAGCDGGRVFHSEGFGRGWSTVVEFEGNVGAYCFFEDRSGRIFAGRDSVSNDDFSLWRIGAVEPGR